MQPIAIHAYSGILRCSAQFVFCLFSEIKKTKSKLSGAEKRSCFDSIYSIYTLIHESAFFIINSAQPSVSFDGNNYQTEVKWRVGT